MNDIEILLGDNPFFGIDHLSQERARERLKLITGFDKITEIIEYVNSMGVKGFVVSTHPELKLLIEFMKENTDLLEKMEFYPIMPYVQGYVAKVTEKGTVGAMNEIFSGISTKNKFKVLMKGSVGYLKKDVDSLVESFIDIELDSIKSAKIKTVFLHDVITDLCVGLDLRNVMTKFLDYVKTRHDIEVGLVTKNFPLLIKKLDEWDIEPPRIMTSFNPIGFQMNPNKQECEKIIEKFKNVIAMNTLAGGFVKPEEAARYISNLGLPSAVIGMSTKKHALESINAFRGKQ